MLKKLLKYDFIAVYRYWWIAALVSFVLSLLGGGCMLIWDMEKELPSIVYVITIFLFVLVFIGYIVFSILSAILLFARFYKNFFTDEGYLTFTLPVKRSTLLNSKLIVGISTSLMTSFVITFNVICMFCIGLGKYIFAPDVMEAIHKFIIRLTTDIGWYLPIYIVELCIISILSIAFSTLLMFFCITFASIITKKAKVITSIGIYFLINSIVSLMIQIFTIFGTSLFTEVLESNAATSLLLLTILLFMAVFCTMFYTLEYWLIDRKLNLN